VSYEVDANAHGSPDRIRGLAAQLLDLRPLWPIIAKVFAGHMSEQFASEGAWGGAKWAPLVRPRGRGSGILVDTGRMRNTFIAPQRQISARRMVLTFPSDYAHFHQSGTSRMVARPIIPESYPASGVSDFEDAGEAWADAIVARWGLS
jgi:hypothetical protein